MHLASYIFQDAKLHWSSFSYGNERERERERERATHACLHARVMSQNYKGVDNQIDVQELIILKQHYQGDMH